jgi:hypothetical protein
LGSYFALAERRIGFLIFTTKNMEDTEEEGEFDPQISADLRRFWKGKEGSRKDPKTPRFSFSSPLIIRLIPSLIPDSLSSLPFGGIFDFGSPGLEAKPGERKK